MRVAILGAGAMGSLFGASLFEAGADVTLVDINQAHVDAVNQTGLRLTTDAADRYVRIPAILPSAADHAVDLIIVFTKTLHTSSALTAAARLIGDNTFILSLQNGLDNQRLLLPFRPRSHILIGITTYPADLLGPGHVSSHGVGKISMGNCGPDGETVLSQLVALFDRAGLHAAVDATISVAIWEKVAFNCALNGLCSLCDCTVGELGGNAKLRQLALTIGDEVIAIARSCGVDAVEERVRTTLLFAMDHHHDHKPSMLQDLLAGRRTEIDAINGAVVRRAAEAGMPAPLNTMVTSLIGYKEAGPESRQHVG